MPELIEHIDAIARKKQRAVLFLEFHRPSNAAPCEAHRDYDYQHDETRSAVLAWLDAHGVPWCQCAGFASVNQMAKYLGQVYLDVPFDESMSDYQTLRDYLEYPDGRMRHVGVRFCVMSLDYAMRNAEHDVPGFWERWAEQF